MVTFFPCRRRSGVGRFGGLTRAIRASSEKTIGLFDTTDRKRFGQVQRRYSVGGRFQGSDFRRVLGLAYPKFSTGACGAFGPSFAAICCLKPKLSQSVALTCRFTHESMRAASSSRQRMPTVNLTPSFVRSAACTPAQRKVDYYDVEQRGFLLEVRSSGRQTFYQRYTDAKGRTRQCKIGPAEVLTVEQAREKGREIVAAVLLGADPQQARVDLRAVPTLAEFIRDRYLPHARQSKRRLEG
jgi:hypothetical protein